MKRLVTTAALGAAFAISIVGSPAFAQEKEPARVPAAASGTDAPAAGENRAHELLRQARTAFEPDRATVRRVEIVTRDPDGGERTWYGREARGEADAGKRALLMVLEDPPSVRGFAVLALTGEDATHEMWAYTPPVGRVRKLEYAGMAQPFLGTDLTFGDLGLFDELARGDVRVTGEEIVDGRKVHVIEAVPADTRAYARVLTYVTESGWPVRKEYRDVANRPWRVLTYQTTDADGGAPTLEALRVRDLQTGYETELRYADGGYRDEVPQSLFDPAALARISEEQQLAGLARDAGGGEQPEEAGAGRDESSDDPATRD